ncbi:MAG: amidohydrolase family protein [Woeseiaceae bacterium]
MALAGAALPLVFLLVTCATPARESRLLVVSNGEVVGHLTATEEGRSVGTDYYVDNNGRGPKIREQLTLDERGFPVRWTITGSSLFGADVDETYGWNGSEARWHSQADEGSMAARTAPLYVGNDASPWSNGLYARILLDAPGMSVDVLPSGRLRLQELRRTTIGADRTPITIYALSGIGLNPDLIALDEENRLFAELGGRGLIVREGYESEVDRLQALALELETGQIRDLQRTLAHRYEQAVRIANVHVFDPATGSRSDPVAVVIRDGRIAAVESPPAPGAATNEIVIDGEGGTLVAGLYDMHAHNSLQSGLFYLAAGVTSTRDMGNDNEMLSELLRTTGAGELPGPRITPAGLIEARSPYSARIGIVAGTLDEALEAVRWYADSGYVEIKTYNSMNPEWVQPLVAEARGLGLGVSGHVPAFMSPDEVIAAGYDSIAHINQLMLGWLLEPGEDTRTPLRLTGMKRAVDLDLASDAVRRTIGLMQQHGTAQDTTVVILERLMKSRAGEIQPGDVAYLGHMPIGYQRYRKRTFVPLPEPGDDAAYDAAFDRILDVIGLLHRSGIPLLIGTDDATGFTVHRELELYVEAGISPADTLTLATLGAARYLGQEEQLGSIEPGKLADFFLVSGDPVADISAIRQIRLVASRGAIYIPAEIYSAIGVEPFAAGVAIPRTVGGAMQ